MLHLDPDELPPAALAAVHELLEADGEDPTNWSVRYAWDSGRAYAVVMRLGEEVRAFTVGRTPGGFEAWGVT